MGITYMKKRGTSTHYRYYLCRHAAKAGHSSCPVRTVAAWEIEAAVVALVRKCLTTPEVAARTAREAQAIAADLIDEQAVITELRRFNDLWDELFPAEQERIVQLLIDGVTVHPDRVDIALRADGLHALLAEWQGTPVEATRA